MTTMLHGEAGPEGTTGSTLWEPARTEMRLLITVDEWFGATPHPHDHDRTQYQACRQIRAKATSRS